MHFKYTQTQMAQLNTYAIAALPYCLKARENSGDFSFEEACIGAWQIAKQMLDGFECMQEHGFSSVPCVPDLGDA